MRVQARVGARPRMGSVALMSKPDPMDVETVLECLNRALELQLRSVLEFTTAAGSMFGLETQALSERFWIFAQSELEDTKLLVEKITALGGDPSTNVDALRWHADPHGAVEELVRHEEEVIAALHVVIPHSGQEPRSEALEHLMEHVIMRKQNQVDWMLRALRSPGGSS
jgi:bacterioferritin (cytochrome b1)